jgi:hypothetical protein
MMKYFITLVLTLLAVNANAAILVFSPNGTYTTKTTLSQAATAADTAGRTVVVTTPQVVTTPIVWPKDRELKFERGGVVTFSGAGALTGLPTSNPMWFGAKNDMTSATATTTAFNKAALASDDMFVPVGTYLLNGAVNMSRPNQSIRGENRDTTVLVADAAFAGATRNGATVKALIWYQQSADNTVWDSRTGWGYGGTISNMRLDCGFSSAASNPVEGIHFNKVIAGQIVENVLIWRPSIGIKQMCDGWGHIYKGVTVIGATSHSIFLGTASNGVALIGCFLEGQDWTVPTHLYIEDNSLGITVSGGYMEGCNIAVQVSNQGQVSISGVDFEMCYLYWIYVEGTYAGSVLNYPGPPISINGCSFVGIPSIAGIYVKGAKLGVHDCVFEPATLQNGPTGSIPALYGYVAGGADPVEQYCITESGNEFHDWAVQAQGFVTRMYGTQTGTWTPTVTIGGSSTGITVATVGEYRKTGRTVTVKFVLTFTNKGSNTADIIVGGLPFLVRTLTTLDGGYITFYQNLSGSGVGSMMVYPSANTAQFVIFKSTGASVTALQGSDITNTTQLYGVLTYDVSKD